MGVDMPTPIMEMDAARNKPSVLVVGPRAAGKRTLVSKIIATSDREALLESDATCHSWTIDTKYYTADVDILVARMEDSGTWEGTTGRQLVDHHEALIMVFDQTDVSSFHCLKKWASGIDLSAFEILLCVGNKADRIPNHFGHTAYRRHLLHKGEALADPAQSADFGVQRTDGAALLAGDGAGEEGQGEASYAARQGEYNEWCAENGVEYIEACAINAGFDKCLSQDGDQQGVARIKGALSAHMWPGLTLKPRGATGLDAMQSALDQPSREDGDPEDEEQSSEEDEEDYAIKYELLEDEALDEPWESLDAGYQPLVDGPDGPSGTGTLEPSGASQAPVFSSASETLNRDTAAQHRSAANGPEAPGWVADWGEFQSANTGVLPDPRTAFPFRSVDSTARPADWVASEKPSFDSRLETTCGPSLEGSIGQELVAPPVPGSGALADSDRISQARRHPSESHVVHSYSGEAAAVQAAAATEAKASVRNTATVDAPAATNDTPATLQNAAILTPRADPLQAEPAAAQVPDAKAVVARLAEAATQASTCVPAAEEAKPVDLSAAATLHASTLPISGEDSYQAVSAAAMSAEPRRHISADVSSAGMELAQGIGSEGEGGKQASPMENGAGNALDCNGTLEDRPGLRDTGGALTVREEKMEKEEGRNDGELSGGTSLDDVERLMNEMASMRTSLSGMTDMARRDMAARLAMRMARLFGEEDNDDDT